jgi:hypothetical protein
MGWITILTSFLEVPDSDIGPNNDYPQSVLLVLPFAARTKTSNLAMKVSYHFFTSSLFVNCSAIEHFTILAAKSTK